MGSKRKKRYQSKGNIYPPLVMTGRCYLMDWEESYLDSLQTGDVRFYMAADSMGRDKENPGYDFIGGAGYIKAMIYDGREWQFLVMDDVFTQKEHHFNKKEMPYDTYVICADVIAGLAGAKLYRTYRQHYKLTEDSFERDEDEAANEAK